MTVDCVVVFVASSPFFALGYHIWHRLGSIQLDYIIAGFVGLAAPQRSTFSNLSYDESKGCTVWDVVLPNHFRRYR